MQIAATTTLLLLLTVCAHAALYSQTLLHSWVTVEYDWPNDAMKKEYILSGGYIVENNIVTGIKVYKDEVYLTVPRWRRGVPSTLNRVVYKGGVAVLQPYPNWSYQTLGDCSALQYVQSMEIDHNTGLMWILDTGRVEILDLTPARNLCPPKLVIYDLVSNKEKHSYVFPNEVVNHTSCFLDDLVLDYVNGEVKFVYITDTLYAKLYVYDVDRETSYFFQDPSMEAETKGGFPIDGIAISPKFDYVYYSPLDGMGMFQVPTSVLHHPNSNFGQYVRRVGTRRSRTGGITYGQNSLYYSLLDAPFGVQRWFVEEDAKNGGGYENVRMLTEEVVVRDDVKMRWVDTLAWGEGGYLWFTANDLSKYMDRSKDFSGVSGPNVYVWKVFVNESSYLAGVRKSASSDAALPSEGYKTVVVVIASVFVLLLSVTAAGRLLYV